VLNQSMENSVVTWGKVEVTGSYIWSGHSSTLLHYTGDPYCHERTFINPVAS